MVMWAGSIDPKWYTQPKQLSAADEQRREQEQMRARPAVPRAVSAPPIPTYNGGGGSLGGNRAPAPSGPAAPSGPSAQELAQRAADQAAAAATAKYNAAGKASSQKQNDATRSLADQQHSLLAGFGKGRDTKISNIQAALAQSDKVLLENYGLTMASLRESSRNNDIAEADASFANVANAARERGEIAGEAASQGAGETDILRAQLSALRNYSANQSEVNRSFFDTLRSVNSSVTSLNADTTTSRYSTQNQAESDKEATWSNYYNQMTDTWTQIGNIENSNTNTTSDSSTGYDKKYANSGEEAAKNAGAAYTKLAPDAKLGDWAGKGSTEERALTSSNRAATVNLGGKMKKPEGATLRKW